MWRSERVTVRYVRIVFLRVVIRRRPFTFRTQERKCQHGHDIKKGIVRISNILADATIFGLFAYALREAFS